MTTVAVIGGGLVGSAAAVWLLADGFEVTVFERDPEGRPASTGNAGILNLPEISPLARPSILASVPGWLLDPLGPLTMRARDLPALAPWLARFVYSARPSQVERATAALGFLMKTALADHQELARRAGLALYMRRNGSLYLYDTDAAYRSALTEWKERARYGVDYQEVTVADARAMVPALKGGFERALITPDQWSVTSPLEILLGLRQAVAARGKLTTAAVTEIRPESGREISSASSVSASCSKPSAAITPPSPIPALPSPCRCSSLPTVSSPRRSTRVFASAARSNSPPSTPRRISRAPPPCGRRRAATSPIFPRLAARNGWAPVRLRPIRSPSSVRTPRIRASSSPLATAISA